MKTEQTGQNPSTPAAGAAVQQTPAGAAEPAAGASGEAGGVIDTPAGAPAPERADKGGGKKVEKTGASAAVERATARVAERKAAEAAEADAAKAGEKNADGTADPEQAAADKGGVSTPGEGEAGNEGETGKDTTGGGEGEQAPSDSTVAAPEDWPKELAERVNALPVEARQTVLDIQKDMQAGFTHAMQEISQLRDGAKDAVAMSERFQTDPKGVISELARRGGMEIWFERPLPEGEIPEFKDTAELAEWTQKQTVAAVNKALEERDAATETATAKAQAVDTLHAEIAQAAKAHADFIDHKQAVFSKLAEAPGMSAEDAYRAVTYEPLVKQALRAKELETEVAKLQNQIKIAAAKTTQPPTGDTGNAEPDEMKHLSAGQRAVARAKRKIAARAGA